MNLCDLVSSFVFLAFDHLFLVCASVVVFFFARYYLNSQKRLPGIKLSLAQVNKDLPVTFTGDKIRCVNPATGEELGFDAAATKEEVEECVLKANAAQKAWAKTSFEERKAVLADLMETIVINQKEIANASFLDTGKTSFELITGEIMVSLEKIRYTLRSGEQTLAPESRSVPLIFMLGGKAARIEYYPIGVIGAIIPWNYPFHNFISPVISAIFAGNAIMVKGSEGATWSRRYFQELVQSVLRRRGHDVNLVQLLPGFGATGAHLVQSKGVHKILFIGSPETGKRVMRAASDLLKPVILELGGKDPFVVLPPCDIELCVDRAINGSFFNLGQNCIAAERILVHKSIYSEFSDLLKKKMATMRQGIEKDYTPVDFGAMTMKMQMDKVKELMDDAINKGAKVLSGGQRVPSADAALFFQPTIITDLTPQMKLWTEEAFGPLMLLIPFESNDEAVSIANATAFGLGCSVLSSDRKKAEEVAKQIESGMCVINDYGMSYMLQDLPFGGCKDSGFGRFNGPEGLREFCRTKSVATERWGQPPAFAFPRFIRRPFPDITPSLLHNLMILFYAWGIEAKFSALVTITKLALFGVDKKKNN